MSHDMVVIVPTRGRPDSAGRVVSAWHDTGAFSVARLMFVVDDDDEHVEEYATAALPGLVDVAHRHQWTPMVAKLNSAAADVIAAPGAPFAVGFAGDDHLPRSAGWAQHLLAALRDLGTGVAYGDDGMHGRNLSTQWVMTSDIVAALGRMVPADVEHLYSDTSVMELGKQARCLTYVPSAVIEHVHPFAGKTVWDDGYRRVNAPTQYASDRAAYRRWIDGQMAHDVAAVRALMAASAPA